MTTRYSKLTLALLATGMLAGCLGGGGDSSGGSTSGTMSGVAAVGSPIVNGTINVQCAAGNALSATTSSTGAWQVTLSGQTLPCAVQASGGTINSMINAIPYHSIATSQGATVNVTPLTDLIVANLAGTSTPSVWFAALSTSPATLSSFNQASVDSALAKLRTALNGLAPLSSNNPITMTLTATPGTVGDDMLSALTTAMGTSGVTYASLLGNASLPAFTAPVAGFDTALSSAYAGTASGGGTTPTPTPDPTPNPTPTPTPDPTPTPTPTPGSYSNCFGNAALLTAGNNYDIDLEVLGASAMTTTNHYTVNGSRTFNGNSAIELQVDTAVTSGAGAGTTNVLKHYYGRTGTNVLSYGTETTTSVMGFTATSTLTYTPPMSQPIDLAVNASYTIDTTVSSTTMGINTTYPLSSTTTALGIETLSVPAGTYSACKTRTVSSSNGTSTTSFEWIVADGIHSGLHLQAADGNGAITNRATRLKFNGQ